MQSIADKGGGEGGQANAENSYKLGENAQNRGLRAQLNAYITDKEGRGVYRMADIILEFVNL